MKIPHIICYDAGHGGHDPGAVGTDANGNRVEEKGIVLPVCLRSSKILDDHGIATMQTRSDDRFVGLTERARIANRAKAGLFLSVHANSAANRSARGIETFVWTGTTISEPWGRKVQDAMVSKFPNTPNRGLKKANFTVLSATAMPACLAELGFLSNTQECTELATQEAQERHALALAIASLEMLGVDLIRQQTVADLPEAEMPYEDQLAELADIAAELSRQLAELAGR